jgi:hypothetical protein
VDEPFGFVLEWEPLSQNTPVKGTLPVHLDLEDFNDPSGVEIIDKKDVSSDNLTCDKKTIRKVAELHCFKVKALTKLLKDVHKEYSLAYVMHYLLFRVKREAVE